MAQIGDVGGLVKETTEVLKPQTRVASLDKLSTWTDKVKKPPIKTDWVVRNFLSSGDITLIAGPGGVGKSMLAAHIALQTVQGKPVYGSLDTKQGNVLWLDNENGITENDRRAQKLDRMTERNFGKFNIYFSEVPEYFFRAVDEDIERTTELIDAINPVLVIIDSFVSIFPDEKSENTSTDVRPIMDSIAKMIKIKKDGTLREFCPSALIVHHTKKSPEDDGWAVYRGSTDVLNAVSILMTLRGYKRIGSDDVVSKRVQMRWEKTRNFKTPEEVYEFEILDQGSDDPNSELHWLEFRSYGIVLNTKKIETKLKPDISMKICGVMDAGEEYQAFEIAERLNIDRTHRGFRSALDSLSKDGYIIESVRINGQKVYKKIG